MVKMVMLERFWRQKRNGLGDSIDVEDDDIGAILEVMETNLGILLMVKKKK